MPRSPAFLFAVLFSLGIFLTNNLSGWILTAIVAMALIVWLSITFIDKRKKITCRSFSVYGLAVLCGSIFYLSRKTEEPQNFNFLSNEEQEFRLEALSFASGLSSDEFFDASIIESEGEGNLLKARIYLERGSSSLEPIALGAEILCSGKAQQVSRSRNPGQTDFSKVFARKGIYITLRNARCELVNPSPWILVRISLAFRNRVKSGLSNSSLDPKSKGISLALLIGDRSALPADLLDSFRTSGLMHLLAISGLHVGFIALGLFRLLSGVLRRCKLNYHRVLTLQVSTVLFILVIYLFVTGANDSVLRASIMCSVFLLSLCSGRPFNSINSLGISAIIILVIRPSHLFEIGFQLSFSAVLGILLLYPKLRQQINSFTQGHFLGFAQAIALSFVAFLSTSSILLAYFSYSPIIGIVSSVFAAPLCFLTLVCAWLWIFTSETGLIGDIFERSLELSSQGFALLAAGASHEYGTGLGLQMDHSEIWIILSILFVLIVLGLYLYQKRPLLWICILLLPSIAFASLSQQFAPIHFHDIIFFDVGHGDSTLIRTNSGQVILIDAGDKNEYYDYGSSVLIPAFRYFGIDKIDLAIISHRHRDHFGGYESLLESVEIDKVISNDDGKAVSNSWEVFKTAMISYEIEHVPVQKGDELQLGELSIEVLSPEMDSRLENENNQSLQLLIRLGEISFLFLGDSELEQEWLLIDSEQKIDPDIVKVGHHGSKTSSSPELLDLLKSDDKDQLAIISASNRFRTPSKDKMLLWNEAGFGLECTCENGRVWIKTDGKHFYTSS